MYVNILIFMCMYVNYISISYKLYSICICIYTYAYKNVKLFTYYILNIIYMYNIQT